MGASSDNTSLNPEDIYVKSQGRLLAVLQRQVIDFHARQDIEGLPILTSDGKIVKNPTNSNSLSAEQASQMFMAPGILPPGLLDTRCLSAMAPLFQQPSKCPAPPPFRGRSVEKVIKSDMDWKAVDPTVTELEVDANCFTGDFMHFLKASNLSSLRTIHFKDNCASSIDCVTIRNNPYLTDLTVGNNCFSGYFDANMGLYLSPAESTPKVFCVMLNYSLEHISIGKFSFTRYSTFTLARSSSDSVSRHSAS